jgi:hypothetical protein
MISLHIINTFMFLECTYIILDKRKWMEPEQTEIGWFIFIYA